MFPLPPSLGGYGNFAMDFFGERNSATVRINPTLQNLLDQRDPQDPLHHRLPVLVTPSDATTVVTSPVAEKDHPSDLHLSQRGRAASNLLPLVRSAARGPRHAHHVVLRTDTDWANFVVGGDRSLHRFDHPTLSDGGSHSLWEHVVRDPRYVVDRLWHLVTGTVGYVVWNYADFVEQFRSWNGTLPGLLTHVGLLWRTLVTVVLTLGLLELGPLVDGLSRLLAEVGTVLAGVFHLSVRATEELWALLALLWRDLWIPVEWMMGSSSEGEEDV